MADTVPRQTRLEIPGVPRHVVQRGVNRCAIFLDDGDLQHYLQLLAEAATQGMALHACVLMTNHVHPLVSCPFAGAISRAMRQIGQSYTPASTGSILRCGLSVVERQR
ncbi:transposase [Pseudoxanthomonas sp. JBR18]|uniref:transposase n=1 Tax=Pseudoxanthomonas sp. JBR18 TaxID=2969308 RepID=UPI002305A45F|nr:transposase [Pseudoxanthomonas sp. JBR18]WCE05586.1 transposase [Pseudoxanthomonas sp. JBR18]